MPDNAHRLAIEIELKAADQSLKDFDEFLQKHAKLDDSVAVKLLGQVPGAANGQDYQKSVNDALLKEIKDMGNMTFILSEAVRHLRAAIGRMPTETP